MAKSTHVVILSGEGPHSDPWHPLPDTSAALAGILGRDHPVTLVTTVDDLAGSIEGAGVLVVNASADRTEPIPEDQGFGRLLDRFLGRGGGLLATHSSTIAFPALPSWRSALGATWSHGRTFHPPLARTLIRRTGREHPITEGLGDFWVVDERYTDLDLVDDGGSVPLYEHTENGDTHPLVWTRTAGNGRVVYDALGHDLSSYASPEHTELLRRSVSWLSDR